MSVLVTDGYWRKSLACVRALGRAGINVVCGEATPFATALFSRYVRKRAVYPHPSTGEPFINRIIELLGAECTVQIPKRPGEPDRTLADINEIGRVLEWSPSTNIETGVARMLENIGWWRDAPVWTPDGIAEATRDWFRYLSRREAGDGSPPG